MSYGEARSKLRRHYALVEALEAHSIGRSVSFIAVGLDGGDPSASPSEGSALKVVVLSEQIEEVNRSLSQLPYDYRQCLVLRYRDNLTVRATGRELHLSKSSAFELERNALAAFISALGCIPVESSEIPD